MPILETEYAEKNITAEDAFAIFKEKVAIYWSLAKIYRHTGQAPNLEKAKKSFFDGLSQLLNFKFQPDDDSILQRLTDLKEFENLDWTDPGVMDKLSESMEILLVRPQVLNKD